MTFYQRILLIAVCVFFVTAWNSHGYFHADEHYQIVEFAGIKLGTHTPNDVAWEFREQIRPTLQATLCFMFLKVVSIENPYLQMQLLRLLTACFSLITIHFFIKKTQQQFEEGIYRNIYYILSYGLWFLPFLSVRFSSETIAALCFIWAWIIYNKPMKYQPILIGVFLGLSFLFRFQMAFAMLGLGLWWILIEKVKISFLVQVGLIFGLLLLIGTGIDSWFYGEFVFSPWKYFYANIVEGVASSFGTSPWYDYFVQIFKNANPFIGTLIFISFFVVLITNPKNVYIWCIIPFVLIHSLIAHKELRFLFPMIYFVPILLTIMLQKGGWNIIAKYPLFKYIFLIVFAIINLIGMVMMAHKSADLGRITLTKYFYDNYHDMSINIIHTPYSNPYNPWGVPKKFYLTKNIRSHQTELMELNIEDIKENAQNFFIISYQDSQQPKVQEMIKKHNFEYITQSVPVWINTLQGYIQTNNGNLMLYRYKKSN